MEKILPYPNWPAPAAPPPAATEATVTDITADTVLPATTKFYDPMTINWRHMADGKSCPDCTADGSTANQVYVTLATPA